MAADGRCFLGRFLFYAYGAFFCKDGRRFCAGAGDARGWLAEWRPGRGRAGSAVGAVFGLG